MLQVALRVFAETGFQPASMDRIADGVGVTKPMLYAYFGSKRGLYRSVIERGRQQLVGAITAASDRSAPPDVLLWERLRAFFRFVAENKEAWALIHGEVSARGGEFAEELDAARDELVRTIADLLREAASAATRGAPATETIALAYALVGACESLAGWWLRDPSDHPDLLALRMMNFAWRGLGELSEGHLWLPPGSTLE